MRKKHVLAGLHLDRAAKRFRTKHRNFQPYIEYWEFDFHQLSAEFVAIPAHCDVHVRLDAERGTFLSNLTRYLHARYLGRTVGLNINSSPRSMAAVGGPTALQPVRTTGALLKLSLIINTKKLFERIITNSRCSNSPFRYVFAVGDIFIKLLLMEPRPDGNETLLSTYTVWAYRRPPGEHLPAFLPAKSPHSVCSLIQVRLPIYLYQY